MEPVLLPDVRQEGYRTLDKSTRGPWLGAAYLPTPVPLCSSRWLHPLCPGALVGPDSHTDQKGRKL